MEHDLEKTNLVTLPDMTDRYVCRKCGAKFTRFGLSDPVLDKKYRKPKYFNCLDGQGATTKTKD